MALNAEYKIFIDLIYLAVLWNAKNIAGLLPAPVSCHLLVHGDAQLKRH